MVAARRQAVGVRRVDPADQGLRDPLERLAAEPAPDEAAEALVPGGTAARQDQVEPQPELPAPGEDARRQHRPRAGRRQEEEPLRQRVEPSPAHDVGAPKAIVRPPEPGAEPDPLRERQRPRLLGDEGVRAGLEQEAVDALGADRPAQPVGRLEEDEVERPAASPGQLDQAVRRREPGDAASDDDDPERRHLLLRPAYPAGGAVGEPATGPAGGSALRQFMDGVDERPDVVDRGSGEDAVAEVEDVARPAGGLRRGSRRACAPDLGGRGEQRGGVEVALDRDVVADAAARPRPARRASRAR